jgi:hypothetical protein
MLTTRPPKPSGDSVTDIPKKIMNQSDEARYESSLMRHMLKIGLAEGGYVRNLMALIKQGD